MALLCDHGPVHPPCSPTASLHWGIHWPHSDLGGSLPFILVTWGSHSHILIFIFVFPGTSYHLSFLFHHDFQSQLPCNLSASPSLGFHPTCYLHQDDTISEWASVAYPHCCAPWLTSLLISRHSHVNLLHVRAQRIPVDLWMIRKWVWIIFHQRTMY